MPQGQHTFVRDVQALFDTGVLKERVAELRRVEKVVGDHFRDGQVTETDLDIVGFYRLEADESLGERKPMAEECK